MCSTYQAVEQDVCDEGELAVLLGGNEAGERGEQLQLLPGANLRRCVFVVVDIMMCVRGRWRTGDTATQDRGKSARMVSHCCSHPPSYWRYPCATWFTLRWLCQCTIKLQRQRSLLF